MSSPLDLVERVPRHALGRRLAAAGAADDGGVDDRVFAPLVLDLEVILPADRPGGEYQERDADELRRDAGRRRALLDQPAGGAGQRLDRKRHRRREAGRHRPRHPAAPPSARARDRRSASSARETSSSTAPPASSQSLTSPLGGRSGSARTRTAGTTPASEAATCSTCCAQRRRCRATRRRAAAVQVGGVNRSPLARAAVVGGRGQPCLDQSVGVLLALGDKDDLGGVGGQQRGQPVGDRLDAVHAPEPAAGAVRPTLAERLGLVADDLIGSRPSPSV